MILGAMWSVALAPGRVSDGKQASREQFKDLDG